MKGLLATLLLVLAVACSDSASSATADAGLSAAADAAVPGPDAESAEPPDASMASDAGADAGNVVGADAGPDAGAADTGPACSAAQLLAGLGKTKLMVGASMEDATAKAAPFDLRYLYLAGGLFDGSAPCASCASGCTGGGQDCSGKNPKGCAWWGCWQWDQDPPGQYLRDFLARAKADGQVPMVTYYEVLQTTKVTEGGDEVSKAANDAGYMGRMFNDFRFVLQQIGSEKAIVHYEPDFWGYAEQLDADPTKLTAAVASANPTDCAAQPNTIAGLGRCVVAMARKYAPGARIGLHASAWSTGPDVYLNKSATFDVAAEAKKTAAYLLACAPDADLVVVEASDRDAAYYTSLGQNRWWDATNATLPNFHQAFAWATALSAAMQKPVLWWQLPVGNMALPNQTNAWKDNRVDYFVAHADEVAATNAVGMAFGAGQWDQTTPETDNGNLVAKVKAFATNGGRRACP